MADISTVGSVNTVPAAKTQPVHVLGQEPEPKESEKGTEKDRADRPYKAQKSGIILARGGLVDLEV